MCSSLSQARGPALLGRRERGTEYHITGGIQGRMIVVLVGGLLMDHGYSPVERGAV